MFDPLTVAVVAIGAATAVSAVGSIQQGRAAEKAGEFNAQVLEQDAAAEQSKAKYDEEIHRDRVKRLLSEQRAVIGKSGVDISGSPLLATLDTAEKGEMDALAIRLGGDVAARQKLNAASLSRFEGSQSKTASRFQAGSTLLTGAGKTGTLLAA